MEERSRRCDVALRQPNEDHVQENDESEEESQVSIDEEASSATPTSTTGSNVEDLLSSQDPVDEEASAPNATSTTGSDSEDLLSFSNFCHHVPRILAVESWHEFFKLVHGQCPPSKPTMARMLRRL